MEPGDLDEMVPREADRLECEHYGLTFKEAMAMSVENSFMAQTVEVDGEIAAMWGYGAYSLTSSVAIGWLMTSSVVDRYPKLFVKTSKKIVAIILERFHSLRVLVDERHVRAIAWLEHLGFKFLCLAEKPGFIYMEKVR